VSVTAAGLPAGDPVFAAFCAAGLWPGLGKRTAADLPAAGITSPDDVSADRLLKLPRVGRQRAERLFSSFLAAQPTYDVVTVRTPPGGCATTRGRCCP
jgi:exodeoxyribonuclease V alpha subunit